jgi:hypothetical protein
VALIIVREAAVRVAAAPQAARAAGENRRPPRAARTIAGISAWTRASIGQGCQQFK